MECTPHWKRIWITINGRRDHIGIVGASTAMNLVKNDLISGVAIYKPYTESSYKLCLEKLRCSNNSDCQQLIQQISITMNLDACTTWAMLCNYLKFERYVDIENTGEIVKYLKDRSKCNSDMWQFYTLERMFLFKILYLIVDNYENKNHRFRDLYKKFVDEFSITTIRESLFEQFSLLSKETNLEDRDNLSHVTNWVERNEKEQLQILFIILTTLVHNKYDINGFIAMLKSFKELNSSFNLYRWIKASIGKSSTILGIRDLEIGIVLSSLEDFWHNSEMWYPRFKEIDSEIVDLCKNWDSPVLLLAWVALHLTVPLEIANVEFEPQLQSYLRTALHSNTFSAMDEIVSNTLFKDSTPGLTVKMAVFTILEVLCIKLGANTIYDHDGTVMLLGKLLEVSEIAVVWHEGSDEGAKSFYNIAASSFPLHFRPLSIFVRSLIRLKCDTESVVNGLDKLQLYTQRYEHSVIEMTNKTFLLHEPYRPLKNDLVVFEKGTKMSFEHIYKQNVVRFHGRYSYFKILAYIVDLVLVQLQEYRDNQIIETGVEAGYNIILEILKVQPSLIANNEDVKKLLKSSFYLLRSVSKPQVNNVNLTILYFEIIVYQLEVYPEEVTKHLNSMKFLPSLVRDPFVVEDFSNLNILSVGVINNFTSDIFSPGSCDLIRLYIKLVKLAIKNRLFAKEIIFPGLMFLITKIFPKFATQFTVENDKTQKICCKLVSLCHLVLQQDRSLLGEVELLYVDGVVNLFAKKKLYTETLVSIFRIRNVQLELILSAETNYVSGPLLKIVKSVKKALQCVSSILNFTHLNGRTNDLFEEYLWQFSPKGSILSHIGEYKSHSFDNEIPQVAWNVLTNFALISRKPLLQAFKVGSKEIRHWIMQNLRDPLLADAVKISIINFIKACVYEQASMIVAFFNIEDRQMESKFEESVADYMKEYLVNVGKDVTVLSQPLQLAVLELFHVLWKTNKKHVIKRASNEEVFWTSMSAPILKPERIPLDASILTFEIFILELRNSKGNIEANYSSAVSKLFDRSSNFVDMWINRAIAISQIDNLNIPPQGRASVSIILVTVLKKFLLILRRFFPKYEDKWNTHDLEKKCLEILLRCSRDSENKQLILCWMEFCLVPCSPKNKKRSEVLEILECASTILSGYVELYKKINDNDRLTALTLAFTIINGSARDISEDHSLIEKFLRVVTKLFYFEYAITFVEDKNEERKHEKCFYKWIVILKIINTFLKMDSIKDFEYFFVTYSYLDNIFEVLYLFARNKWPVRVREVTMATLICYADSKFNYHFDSQFKNIIYKLMSPDVYKLDINTLKWGVVPEEVKNHWRIYTHVIRLNEILLHRRGSIVIESILLFIERHRSILTNAILSVTTVLTESNLQLVCHILHFMYDVLKHFRQCSTSRGGSVIEAIMNSMNEVLNIGSHILLRPIIVMFALEFDSYKKIPYSEVPKVNLVNIINRYLEITTWSCLCLNQSSPSFHNLLNVYQDATFQIRVKYDFRFPPLTSINRQHLSFNILLSILNFLCNTLTRIANMDSNRELDWSYTEKTELKDYVALIYPWDKKDDINAFVMMSDDAINETFSSQRDWLTRLNTDLLLQSLSALNTFLATQIFLVTRDASLRYDEIYYMRRQLCSDLVCFYKFVHNLITSSNFSKLKSERTGNKTLDKRQCLLVDVSKLCCDEEGKKVSITSTSESYLLLLTHWFKHVCQLVYSSKFDEMLFQLNAKSMRIVYNQIYSEN